MRRIARKLTSSTGRQEKLAEQGGDPGQHPADFAPIFIVGCPRSGTTLLAALLDRHSQIAVPPETTFHYNVLPHLSTDALMALWSCHDSGTPSSLREVHEGLKQLDRCIERLDLKASKVLARWRCYSPTPRDLLRALLEEYAHKEGKRRPSEKTPDHLASVPLILRWYPQAKVICIVRDGRDVVLSLMRMPWAHNNLERHCAKWNHYAWLTLLFQKRYPRRFLRVHLEDLLQHPHQVLAIIDAFVQVPFEKTQLDPNVATAVVPSEEEAWKSKAKTAIDPSHIGVWKRQATSEQKEVMNLVMGRHLRRLNYEETFVRQAAQSHRATRRVISIGYVARHRAGFLLSSARLFLRHRG